MINIEQLQHSKLLEFRGHENNVSFVSEHD